MELALRVKTVTQEELIWAVTVELALIILALTEAEAVEALLGLTMPQALPVVELGAVAQVVQLIQPKWAQVHQTRAVAVVRLGQMAAQKMAALALSSSNIGFNRWLTLQNWTEMKSLTLLW